MQTAPLSPWRRNTVRETELVRRFLALSADRRRLFLATLAEQGISFSQLPIPNDLGESNATPLSMIQQGLWFLSQLDRDSSAYHIAGGLTLLGELNQEALRAAFESLARRHEVLRSHIDGNAPVPLQVLDEVQALPLTVLDLSAEANPTQAARALSESEAQQVFDLQRGPLWRVTLVKLANRIHELWLTLHHLIADGWSMNRLLEEFAELYSAAVERREPRLPVLPIRYSDHAAWQRSWLEAGEAERQLAYWRDTLGDQHPVLDLPADRLVPVQPCHRGGRVRFDLDAELCEALRSLARARGVTPFIVLLTGFYALLHRYTGLCDIRIGVPLANRNRPEIQGLVGYFVNTVVFRVELDGKVPLTELLKRVQCAALDAQAHADLPFDRLVEALRPQRSLGHNPLFQVLFNHLQRGALARLPGLDVENLERNNGGAQFDLSLDMVEDRGDAIEGVFIYATDRFDVQTVKRLCGHYLNMLREIVTRPACRLSELGLLTAAERRQLAEWNRWQRTWPETEPVTALISRRAATCPAAPALICGTERITYGELESASDRLARRLSVLGAGAEQVVGIVLTRSVNAVVAMLGVLKSGAAFLPLDPGLPEARLAELLRDAGAMLTLSDSGLRKRLPANLLWEPLDKDVGAGERDVCPRLEIHPHQLAYLIYTSGSTGTPKAVAVSHGALSKHLQAAADAYSLGSEDVALHFAPFSADTAVEQWAVPLLSGACLVISSDSLWSVERTLHEIGDHAITHIDLPPAYLSALAANIGADGQPPRLRSCVVGGEALPRASLDLILQRLQPRRLINAYGPTETVITPLAWTASTKGLSQTAYAPIGRALGERSLHVLDADLNPLPAGVAGELYIGGPCLARGYAGRPALTAERFLPDPFGAPGSRLYRTGDRVRLGTDGNVEYLGRVDHQVKLRGFRIEPGEIEAQLLRHAGVSEALVLMRGEDASRKLLAYVAADGTDAETLRDHLRECLPDYMVPANIVVLPRLPKLPSGKVDRQALPEPQWAAAEAFRPPVTEAEKLLAQVWAEVLKLEQVGVDHNFFDLGGDSILSLQVVSRARRLGLVLSPADLFRCQTIAALARVARGAEVAERDSGPAQGSVPLTPIQAAFFQADIPERRHWNLSLLLESLEPLDADLLEHALASLVKHHDSLRLRFRQEDGHWSQAYGEVGHEFLWRRHAAGAAEVEVIAGETQRSLDLSQGPLLRAVHIRVAGGERLLLVVHHLVVDGVSWRILVEDLRTVYRQLQAGGAPQPPSRTGSFQAWAQRLETYARDEGLASELGYWERQMENGIGEIPRDFPADGGRFRDAREIGVRLNAEYTHKLLVEAPAAYRTRINDLLLAALARVLGVWSGRTEVALELEGHGREDLFPDIDLSRSVGWFTCQFPVRLTAEVDPGKAIKTVKEQLRQVPRGGIGYGALRYLAEPESRSRLEGLPRPRVGFNYFGQLGGDGLFRPAPESGGADHDGDAPLEFWLEINGHVREGELTLRWRYSPALYRDETVRALAETYIADLQTLIDHCLSGAQGFTPSDFPLAELPQAALDRLPATELEDLYPASPMQQGLLFHARYEPEDRTYVNQLALTIEGLDEERFAAAWREAIRRHEILRTAFPRVDGAEVPLQAVYREVAVPLEIRELGSEAVDAGRLAALASAEHGRGFDLARPPLQRLLLVRLPHGRHHLIWTSHHLLLDGWSTSALLGEVLDLYHGKPLRARPAPYRDYIAWLQARDLAAGEAFWRAKLAPMEQPTRLADVLICERRPGGGRNFLRRRIDADARWLRFAKAQRITLNTLLQGAWLLLLQRCTGQRTVAMGATIAGRPEELADAEAMLGLFINTLPAVQTLPASTGAADWLRNLQADNLALRQHEQVPLAEIQRWSGQGGALFDTLLVFENYPVDQALRAAGGELRFEDPVHVDTTHYPLTLNVSPGEPLTLVFGYSEAHFDAGTIEWLAERLEHVVSELVRAPERPLGCLGLANEKDLRLIARCNSTTRPCDALLLPEIVDHRAAAVPHADALWYEGETLSYGELERWSNRLAHRLRRLGVGPDKVVGIALERSFHLVAGILGILKAGGAYLPLDPDYPAERLRYMLEDAGIDILLSRGPSLRGLALPVSLRCLDPGAEDLEQEADTAPVLSLHPQNLAYVLYTSGSTGRPKGVGNTHGALANRLHWMQEAYALGTDDTVLQKTPFGFDVSVWEFLWPLMTGARLAIAAPGDHRDPARLAALMRKAEVTTLHFVPSMLQEFLARDDLGGFPRLRRVLCSGEALSPELRNRVFERLPGMALHNLYGPTEAAIDVSHWTCRPTDGERVPIGQPIANLRLHVLDTELNPLPVGVAGELYLSGAGLARGYPGRPGLSAERFIPDPQRFGERLYRTGDRARLRADGSVDYLGRLDGQIKLRGMRIELGEIEAALLRNPKVREAAVLLRQAPAGPCLVAYVAAGAQRPEEIRERLRACLPASMVPAHIVSVASLPKTPNGKLDRRALPAPEQRTRDFRTPESDTERRLAMIWQELLGTQAVGRDDDFFELGGHSLLAMRLAGRIKAGFGVELSVRAIFEASTLHALAAELDRALSPQPAALEDEIAAALAELDGLSPEALQALLAGEA